MWWMLGVVATVAAAEGPVRLTRPEPPEVDLAAAAEELRLEAIARLEPLVVAATGDERAERALRLASLLADEARVLRMRELAAGGDPRPDGSLRWTDRSIRVARAIVDQHPRWERWDEAATLLASTLEEAGKAAEADEAWVALVRARPASPHATDAWIAIGQRALDTSDAGRAVAALEHAARDTEHPRHAWALYALAWARYGAGDVDGGIVALRRVIANTANAPEGALRMDQEAIGDLPRFYADADRVDEGIEVLTGLGRADLADAALARLASALDEQGRPSEAAAVYRRLLVASPEAPDAPRWTASLAGALVADGRPSEALDVFTDALADQAWDELEAPLLRQALAWHEASRQHRRGRADDTEALAGLADRAYALWMRAFPASEEAVEVRYAAAELAWELGRIREARDGYAAVFEADPMGPHARFCAESAVFASRKLVGPIERLTPGPLTEADRLLLADDERLIALDLHRVEATWETAYLLYHRGELDRAAERFAEVVALDPRSRDAEVAAHLILDALATQERWATLAQTASAFAAQPELGNATFRREVTTIGERASFRAAQPELGNATFRREVTTIGERASFRAIEASYGADHDAHAAARAFEALADRTTDVELQGPALHDAAMRYDEAGRWADGLRLRERLVDDPRYASAATRREDLRLLGFGLESIADFAGAATRYEALFAGGGDAAGIEALWSAAVFRHALGQDELALVDYTRFAEAASADERAPDALLRSARLLVALDRRPEAERVLTALAHGHDEAAAEAAEAQLLVFRADDALAAYAATAIDARTEDALRTTLQARTLALGRAEVGVQAVVAAGDGQEALRLLDRLGDAWHAMADALREAPVPSRLTEDQARFYRDGVADRAYALDERAVEAWSAVVRRSAELSLYGSVSASALRKRAALRPEAWDAVPEQLPSVVWATPERPPTTWARTLR